MSEEKRHNILQIVLKSVKIVLKKHEQLARNMTKIAGKKTLQMREKVGHACRPLILKSSQFLTPGDSGQTWAGSLFDSPSPS